MASPLDANALKYTYSKSPRAVPREEDAVSGSESICTDHMIVASWKKGSGWSTPELKPYGPLQLSPTASCLHYATERFEGMKVYRGYDGKLRLFRPELNASRMCISASRISLPTFDPNELEKLIVALVSTDGPKWLPSSRPGGFLYLRPALIGTQAQLGVGEPQEALLFIVMSFMGRLDSTPLRLLTSPDDMIRAWTGGFGFAKIGSNYGSSVLALREAHRRGFNQVLWLYGEQGECTEAGGSNLFVVLERPDGKKQLITAPLGDKLILDGITRRSCIELAKERMPEIEVIERRYTINELIDADANGRIVEAFSTGTAYFVCPISHIHHRGIDIEIPLGPEGATGDITLTVKRWFEDIQYGNAQGHPWGVVVPETRDQINQNEA